VSVNDVLQRPRVDVVAAYDEGDVKAGERLPVGEVGGHHHPRTALNHLTQGKCPGSGATLY